MAKPDYEEVMKQRNAAREELAAVQGERDDARKQVEALQERIAELKASPPVSNGLPEDAPSAPAIHEIPDDDPSDPRPEMHPALGWTDPAVIEWAERRKAKAEPETASE